MGREQGGKRCGLRSDEDAGKTGEVLCTLCLLSNPASSPMPAVCGACALISPPLAADEGVCMSAWRRNRDTQVALTSFSYVTCGAQFVTTPSDPQPISWCFVSRRKQGDRESMPTRPCRRATAGRMCLHEAFSPFAALSLIAPQGVWLPGPLTAVYNGVPPIMPACQVPPWCCA